jgi:hypothetical protein
MALLTVGISVYLWFAQEASHVTDGAHTETVGNSGIPTGAIRQNGKDKKQLSKPATNDSAAPTGKTGLHPRSNDAVSGKASLVVYPDEDPQVPYFTVGSTKNDVIRIQGPPSKVASDVFVYGSSQIYFKNGRVESWRSDPSSPLKARMAE